MKFECELYTARFPWKENVVEMDYNFELARKRFQGLAQKLRREKVLRAL